jgi:ABC-2 type transport system permease protein
MSTIAAIFRLNYHNTFRNLKSSGIMFVLPIVFMAIFGLAFGQENTFDFTLGTYQSEFSQELDLKTIFEEVSQESDSLEITVREYETEQSLVDAVDSEQVDVGVVTTSNVDSRQSSFEVIVPSDSLGAEIERNIVSDILTQIVTRQEVVSTRVLDPESQNLSGFDFLVPGLIIYGLIILIPGVAESFTRIIEKKYIFRFAFSRISSVEIITGTVLFYLSIGVIQAFLLYYTSLLFGYQVTGSVLVAIVPILLSLLFCIAVGIMIGAFFKKSEAATNTGTIVSIIFGFFSGSFIAGIGNILEFELFGRTFQFNDFLPTKWGTQAVEAILTKDQGLTDIQLELWVLAISGLVFVLLAAWVFSVRQLKYRG